LDSPGEPCELELKHAETVYNVSVSVFQAGIHSPVVIYVPAYDISVSIFRASVYFLVAIYASVSNV
jgi:hypothetical protein